jgi:hypothetical protein
MGQEVSGQRAPNALRGGLSEPSGEPFTVDKGVVSEETPLKPCVIRVVAGQKSSVTDT